MVDPSGATSVSDDPWSLARLQAEVGGWIEVIEAADSSWCAFVNEDGVGLGLLENLLATRLAIHAGWQQYPPGWLLRGIVVFFGPADDKGEQTDVTDELLEHLAAVTP